MARDFQLKLNEDRLQLHDAFAANLFVAHSIDHMHEVARILGDQVDQASFARAFDEHYELSGKTFSRHKFELVDLINNSLKHVEIDPARRTNRAPLAHHGRISFKVLSERGGRVYCELDRHRFDYGRAAADPRLLAGEKLVLRSDVLDLVRGEYQPLVAGWDVYDDDPIDRMIAHVNRSCGGCGGDPSDCECETFTYDGKPGRYEPIEDDDFDAVMSGISGAYSPD